MASRNATDSDYLSYSNLTVFCSNLMSLEYSSYFAGFNSVDKTDISTFNRKYTALLSLGYSYLYSMFPMKILPL